MVAKTATYGRLKSLLESLGTVCRPLPGDAGESLTTRSGRPLFQLSKYHVNDHIRPAHLVLMHRQLDENGYLERADFERFLDQRERA
jgi:hypothetical protein